MNQEPGRALVLAKAERERLWRQVTAAIEGYAEGAGQLPILPRLDPVAVRALLAPMDFERPLAPEDATRFVIDGLTRFQLHFANPAYIGLFNPHPSTMGVAAEAIAAAFNCQLAAWRPCPFGVEVEEHLIRTFGSVFGYPEGACEGAFATGGSEANHTALLLALTARYPDFTENGLVGREAAPVIYASTESHHSVHKSAIASGLGTRAVREVALDARLRMDVAALAARIREDRAGGRLPLMVVATAGTTNSGAIDPLREIAELAAAEGLWLHVDAAYGGAAALLPELRGELDGIERADSITFDFHKWMSVPMGAGLVLTRHAGLLERTFHVDTHYMARTTGHLGVVDPHGRSLQWSRRFIGLKVFLTLAVAGWEGYRETLRHQLSMATRLRKRLAAEGWRTVNDSPLPIVCFVDERRPDGESAAYLDAVAREIAARNHAWISTTRLAGGRAVLRACVINLRTAPEHIELLLRELAAARAKVGAA